MPLAYALRQFPAGPPPEADLFLIIGQSNCLGGATLSATLDYAGPNLFQWGRVGTSANRYIEGNEPLQNNEVVQWQNLIGFAVAFARDYYVPNALAQGRVVLLVPAARGGTGFTNGWAVGDTLYNEAIASANAAMAANPGNVFKGVFWQGGEAQADQGWTEVQYTEQLDALIAGMRAGITGATDVPFIIGGMVPGWVAADVGRQPVADALANTPGRVANTGYADPSVPSVLGTADIHYNADAQRNGMAGRYWTAWQPFL